MTNYLSVKETWSKFHRIYIFWNIQISSNRNSSNLDAAIEFSTEEFTFKKSLVLEHIHWKKLLTLRNILCCSFIYLNIFFDNNEND
jgi:hypothetical protein